ncbi:MAG TPA: ABATE domain-containing protein [Pyrinomonadaceae bacterium]|jgi:predicted RNA-binding Zn ribbon-like protein
MTQTTQRLQLVAGHLALDFANTLDNRYDRERLEDLLPTYERFLAFTQQAGIITRGQQRTLLEGTKEREARQALCKAIELREALYLLFSSVATGSQPNRSALRTLNRFLEHGRIANTVEWRNAVFVGGRRDLTERPDGPLWPIIVAAVDLLTSPGRRHIRECSEGTCRWLFLDRSKNHSRLWCDMRVCGNRSKARRFYARQQDCA